MPCVGEFPISYAADLYIWMETAVTLWSTHALTHSPIAPTIRRDSAVQLDINQETLDNSRLPILRRRECMFESKSGTQDFLRRHPFHLQRSLATLRSGSGAAGRLASYSQIVRCLRGCAENNIYTGIASHRITVVAGPRILLQLDWAQI